MILKFQFYRIIYKNFQEHTYALANYFDAIDVNPNNWRAYFNAGLLYFSIKEYGIGIRYIQKCLDINPFYEKALNIYSIYNNSRMKLNKTKLKINEINAKA